MTEVIVKIHSFIWGIPALVLILSVGIFLSFRTKFVQIRLFGRSLKCFFSSLSNRKEEKSDVSPYRALCTALAATVGTGNIAGVAGAIALGGPGSIFWMWVCAFLGMVIKYAEATLSVRYRQRNSQGEWVGGPMYMIQQGLDKRKQWLAFVYCFFGVVAAFGVGNATQVNAVIGGINSVILAFGGHPSSTGDLCQGLLLAMLIAAALLGGARRIGAIAEQLVPFASVCYLLLCLSVLFLRASSVPPVFLSILQGAFSPNAVTGGALGSAFIALRVGVSRGVFTNEAGMGTAAIAHASAQVRHPSEQGLMGIMEVFLDTVVICTMTALVILCSGTQIRYGVDEGVLLTTRAFSSVLGHWVSVPIALSLCCFAVATILGWGLYGARCAQFLFGDQCWKWFVLFQTVGVLLGAILRTGTVWLLSELINGLMAIPNLLALALLSAELVKITKEYIKLHGSHAANGGLYANFNQRQPLRAVSHAEIPPSGGES